MWNTGDRLVVGHQSNMNRHVSDSMMYALDQCDVVRIAVHNLAEMDCNILAPMRRQ